MDKINGVGGVGTGSYEFFKDEAQKHGYDVPVMDVEEAIAYLNNFDGDEDEDPEVQKAIEIIERAQDEVKYWEEVIPTGDFKNTDRLAEEVAQLRKILEDSSFGVNGEVTANRSGYFKYQVKSSSRSLYAEGDEIQLDDFKKASGKNVQSCMNQAECLKNKKKQEKARKDDMLYPKETKDQEINDYARVKSTDKGDKTMDIESAGKKRQALASWDEYEMAQSEIEYRMSQVSEWGGWESFLSEAGASLDENKSVEFLSKIAQAGTDDAKILSIIEEYGLETKLEQEISTSVYEDSDLWRIWWEDFISYLGEVIKGKSPDGYWYARGENMGWRQLSGYNFFSADSGEEFFRAVTPKTNELTFRAYNDGRGLFITVSHHDAPMGERIYCRPLSAKQWDIYENGSEEQTKAMMEKLG